MKVILSLAGLLFLVAIFAFTSAEQDNTEEEEELRELYQDAEDNVEKRLDGATYLGCYTDAGDRDLDGKQVSNGVMTASVCRGICYGYKYFGLQAGSFCFCGNRVGKHGSPVDASQCNQKCSGDQNEVCGGGWRNSVYQLDQQDNAGSASFLGCYVDAGDRDLDGKTFSHGAMTANMCRAFCIGYKYFGLQAGSHCFCGDRVGKHGSPVDTTQCNQKCSGDQQNFCGAGWRNSVYQYASQNDNRENRGANFLGCYIDAGDRDLDAKQVYDSAMNVNMCRAICRDYKYFGLQTGDQCFCGNRVGKHGGPVALSQCNQACPGNPNQFCGAGWRNSVYQNDPNGKFDQFESTYLGCYVDSGDRDLDGKQANDGAMSVKRCRGICAGYKYMGLQAGSFCFCGNRVGKYGLAATSQCNQACSGNDNEFCGGGWRNSVYLSSGEPPVPPPAPTTAPPAPTVPPTAPPCTEDTKVDITFVLDSSGSIGEDNYNKRLKKAVRGIIDYMLPGDGDKPSSSRVAAIVYGSKSVVHWNLDKYKTKNELLKAVDSLPYYESSTATGDALHDALTLVHPKVRPGVKHLVILITDGESNDGTHVDTVEAQKLKDAGATVFAIGVGSNIMKDVLDKISSGPGYRADVTSYSDLASKMKKLAILTCKEAVAL